MPRNISDVLDFRNDFSPFLTHLTREKDDNSAYENLENIIQDGNLKCGSNLISAAQYGTTTGSMNDEQCERFFSAISFTETPLNEIHTLLEISNRQIELEPYGLVFLKERLRSRDVSPAIYINNENNNKDDLFESLCTLIETAPEQAEQILPLFTVFGNTILAPWAQYSRQPIDFLWEREWRYPSSLSPFNFGIEDVFIGLCPHDKIDHFEDLFPGLGFVDPRRNMKWYATKLINARQRLDMSSSVV